MICSYHSVMLVTLCSKSCCDKHRIVPTLFLRLFDNCSLKLRHGAGAMTHNCCS